MTALFENYLNELDASEDHVHRIDEEKIELDEFDEIIRTSNAIHPIHI